MVSVDERQQAQGTSDTERRRSDSVHDESSVKGIQRKKFKIRERWMTIDSIVDRKTFCDGGQYYVTFHFIYY